MPTIIDIIKEFTRQEATGDRDFYKSMTYMFKLHTKGYRGPTGGLGEALFPLPIPPEEFDYTLPFALEITGTQDAGAISEEGGIITGEIRLVATTGWKLRVCKDTSLAAGSQRFTGQLPANESYGQPLSGQMAAWRLIGRCFDSYSELKKDPETAHLTYMEFHSIKDSLHLEVKPRNVRIIRNVTKYRVTYGYEISLAVVGMARQPLNAWELQRVGDDKDILDQIDDYIHMARNYIHALEATVDDLSACAADVQRHITNFAGIIRDASNIITAGKNFVDGVTGFFDATSTSIQSRLSDFEDAMSQAYSSSLPPSVSRSIGEMIDATEGLSVACRGNFRDDWDSKASSHLRHVQSSTRLTDEQNTSIDDAVTIADKGGGQLSAQDVMDAPYRPGDAIRKNMPGQTPSIYEKQFSGYMEVTVHQGDSIETLAIKHAGDPNLWRAIAYINGLRPPFISNDVRIPGTKRVGDKILIPITKPVAGVQVSSLGDAAAGASQLEALMGRDIRLVQLANKHYGWAVDVAHGSTDIQTVYGVKNLVQGLGTRMRTEQLTNPQFPGDGLPRMVGEKADEQLWATARFAFEQQVLADPRIDRVLSIRFSIVNDVLEADIDCQPVGYDTNRVIPLQVS